MHMNLSVSESRAIRTVSSAVALLAALLLALFGATCALFAQPTCAFAADTTTSNATNASTSAGASAASSSVADSLGISPDALVPAIVVLVGLIVLITFFALVFRKTDRNISDMDNMFK